MSVRRLRQEEGEGRQVPGEGLSRDIQEDQDERECGIAVIATSPTFYA